MNNFLARHGTWVGIGSGVSAVAALVFWSFGNGAVTEYVSRQGQAEVAAAIVSSPQHIKTPPAVRAVYMTSWVAGTPSLRENLLKFIRASEINAIIIDVKDYTGKISFRTGDAHIEALGSEEERVPDMRSLIDELHADNIYAIARISVFQDPYLAKKQPQIAVHTTGGGVWKDHKGVSWVDPASGEVWDYTVRIAKATEAVGFDELNFDYVRFPSDGNMSDIAFPVWNGKTSRSDVLEDFFAYLDAALSDISVPISFNLFGMTMTNTDDLNIGQVLEKAAPYADFIAPMVYPSHYPNGWHNFSNPAAHPYEVIHYAMVEGVRRLQEMRLLAASTTSPLYGVKIAELRPWLQDFDLGAQYTADMIRKEKQAVYDAGLDSWMIWDPKNVYTKEAYKK